MYISSRPVKRDRFPTSSSQKQEIGPRNGPYRRSHNSDNKFRRGVPTFVVAGVAVVPRNVRTGPAAVGALAADVWPMAILSSPRVTTLCDGGLVGSELEQRLLLVIAR